MDYINGTTYKTPPKIQYHEVEAFKDSIPDMVEGKVMELAKRMIELETERSTLPPIETNSDPLTEYTVRYIRELDFAEYYACQLWLRYYLRLNELSQYEGEVRDLEAVKCVPIRTLYPYTLKKAGKQLTGRCPFHNDKTPSFYVYEESNSFYCFGCHAGGDVINYVELSQNVNFREAVKILTHVKQNDSSTG